MQIAFIGLGNMGAPMARNLIKAGHQLNLFDLNKTVLAELAELGGQISASPKEAAASSELVITTLPAAATDRSDPPTTMPEASPGACEAADRSAAGVLPTARLNRVNTNRRFMG